MTDNTELKRLATRIVEVQTSQDVPISKLFDDFDAATSPEVVLALIAEYDAALREATSLAMAIWRRRYAKDSPNFQPFEKASSVIGQIDNMAAGLMSDLERLKAENETLISVAQALRDEWRKDQADAERYRWLSSKTTKGPNICVSEWVGPHEYPLVGEELDFAIDAAMGKGEQS